MYDSVLMDELKHQKYLSMNRLGNRLLHYTSVYSKWENSSKDLL